MENKSKKIKSICGKYTLTYYRHVSEGVVTDSEGIKYVRDHKCGKNKAYYSLPHMMLGYSAWAKGLDSRKFFTVHFADCKKDVRIVPYSGNTILKEYSAIFRVQKIN